MSIYCLITRTDQCTFGYCHEGRCYLHDFHGAERVPTTPDRAADASSAEAQALLDELAQKPVGGFWDGTFARALDAFAQVRADAAVARERERCAAHAKVARSEAAIERHKTDDPEGKACWLWAFDTANGIERAIRSGEQP